MEGWFPHGRWPGPALAPFRHALKAHRARFVIAGALIAAPAAFLATAPLPPAEPAAGHAPEAAALDGASRTEAVPRSNVVFDAWYDFVREREIEGVASSYADRFRIPVSLATQIYSAASAEGIRPEVAFGLIRAESSFRPRVVSRAGAVGLTQVLPSTGRWIVPGTTRRDLMEPETNLRVGFRYLRYLYDKYDGDERLALTAYNRGPGTVDRHLRRGANPDNGYVEMVLTGHSQRHTNLMNARFGRRRS
jgi:soluble lytic murein transglycosylase-like protein